MNRNEELKSLNVEKLREKVDFFRRELFSLKLTAATSHLKDNSQFKKLRRDVARALTILRQKEASKR